MKFTKIIIYILLLCLAFGIFLYQDSINVLIPYDDAYSAFMIRRSYLDILRITASDVHPPLYYWLLKTYSLIFDSSMFALRVFSALGMMAILLLGCFPIRRHFGDRVAIIFIILLIIFPVTQYLVTDIRMYSWCMFFVLACALFAYDVYLKERSVDWLKFFAMSVCAAYTHNYGLLGVFWIYILLLIFLFRAKKKWLHLIILGVVFSVIYSPWLYQLTFQIEDVVSHYWIVPLTLNDIFVHIYYFYSPKIVEAPFLYFTKIQMMVGLIFLMLVQCILTAKVFVNGFKQKNKQVYLSLIAFVAFLLPIATAFIISIIYLPILVPRYMTCSFGLYVLSIAIILARAMDLPRFRQLAIAFLILLTLFGAMRFYSCKRDYKVVENAYADIRRFIASDGKDEHIFVVNFYSHFMLSRVELIAPGNRYCVLVPEGINPRFEPFNFEKMGYGDPAAPEFILLNQDRPEVQEVFYNFYDALQKDFMTVDSLRATDIFLYRMKARKLIEQKQ
ncbi:glycosyltransferase family 39 protein [Dysgonomonas sp. ZJ279]|uniref:glycosyltransferase family 39 protein n=1 Tax=Dysgonomonas sp. ZJ279 TaxID=2709796 RepID=UPI0013E9C14F|nr:glycosyltransferase family 39 protein [Dysgonomonas sp. ZJ279]